MKRLISNPKFWVLLLLDVVLVASGYFLSYFIRFDFHIPEESVVAFKSTVVYVVLFKLVVFYLFKLYKTILRHMGMVDLLNAVKANISASILIIAAFLVSGRPVGSTAGVFVIDSLIGVIFIGGLRAVIRLIFLKINKKGYFKPDSGVKEPRKTVVIAGAGGAGEKILREIRDNPRLNYEVIGFLDDDRKKTGLNIHGTFVLGGIEQLEEISKNHRLDEVIIAIPSATGKEMRRVVEICNRSGLQFRTTPVLEDIISGKVKISKLRNVSYEDILGRTPVVLETGLIETYLRDKRVLVTGAGGSIGSELCWQISHFSPSSLILCDNTENNLFHVDMDLREEFPSVNTCSVLSDVRNLSQMEGIFKKYKPDVIFHAAAYKHVPMMELNPWEAVHNNIRGTMNILSLASNNNVERFVMVSTDKAVRPCNIMGATKRVAELLTQAHALNYNKIRFMTVRFGNVLGSKGSVIPIFKEQIKRGGPVKVTHPEITRYFMTISEASQLILQAGAMGEGAEIFILDMGTPVRIVDIARDLIRLSGLESNEDIEIEFIGLRPGEKLHEELITEGEGIVKTAHEKIMVLKAQGLQMDKLNSDVEELIDYAYKYDAESIKRKLKEIVPDYNPYDNDAGDK